MPDAPPRFHVSHARQSAFHATACARSTSIATSASTPRPPAGSMPRSSGPIRTAPGRAGHHQHALDFQIVYVLKGWVVFDYEGVGNVRLEAGDCVHQPPGIVHAEIEHSDDLEMLEITAPARFETTAVEPR